MATYKNIRLKKRGGGTRLQRVQVLASGKYKFVKNLTKGKSSTSKSKSRSKVANNRKKPQRKIPLVITGGFMATVLGGKRAGQTVIDHLMKKDYTGAFYRLSTNLTGWNPAEGFNLSATNYEPLIVASVITLIVRKLGLNRYLRDIPFVKL